MLFLDPNHENIGFLHDEKYNKKFRIKSYHDFKKIVLNDLNNKKIKSIINPYDFLYEKSKRFKDNI